MKKTSDSVENLQKSVEQLTQKNQQLERQLDWFKRQLFGRKSEVRQEVSPHQGRFDAFFPDKEDTNISPQKTEVSSHQRRKKALKEHLRTVGCVLMKAKSLSKKFQSRLKN